MQMLSCHKQINYLSILIHFLSSWRKSLDQYLISVNNRLPEFGNNDSLSLYFKTRGTFQKWGSIMENKVTMCLDIWNIIQIYIKANLLN